MACVCLFNGKPRHRRQWRGLFPDHVCYFCSPVVQQKRASTVNKEYQQPRRKFSMLEQHLRLGKEDGRTWRVDKSVTGTTDSTRLGVLYMEREGPLLERKTNTNVSEEGETHT
ncbi:hypothetical protein MPTK1_1g22220 [Marchantia polymorpha subsp. ruderalis]|uniref:Uncharacterized protein n=2 Tax=Marchantia polymorpha TaxID=3197 RepID=A0AAF6AT18_MARPO|nr:hypothetical protein MARPO_0001s0560 [Marchantia polymorpha]BBM99588.1 hypothetical protein Mp_1g22220 [Marchantia polymorpha subsp. ruderalis]|eukprot:PTQ50676.1 hypothetical protein MARPO_0001s0560 [Marchantia polymorpha]